MTGQRNRDFQTRAATRFRLDDHFTSKQTEPFFDDPGTLPRRVEVPESQAARKGEAAAVVVDRQDAVSIHNRTAHEYIAGPAVLADVHERLLKNAHDFAAGARRQRDP